MKNMAYLSHKLQSIFLYFHQYGIKILYKPRPQQFIVDWLFRHNHEANKDKETPGMYTAINTKGLCMDRPDYMTAEDIRLANLEEEFLGMLSEYV